MDVEVIYTEGEDGLNVVDLIEHPTHYTITIFVAEHENDLGIHVMDDSILLIYSRTCPCVDIIYTLPGTVDATNVVAAVKNGVLDLVMPKGRSPPAAEV